MSGHPGATALDFDTTFRDQLRELFVWRRDTRHFRADALPSGALDRLLELAALAPSVGLSQPWRFVTVQTPSRRAAIVTAFQRCNAAALDCYDGEQAARYARLKLAGLQDAPAHVAVFAARDATGHGLGQLTMPEMAEYSVVAAVQLIWLAARAEGIGLGWVSILPPAEVTAILEVPADWRFIGYLCLGYPSADHDSPELERAGWERRRAVLPEVLRR